ncbi:MAG: tryptophan 7-halogenase, partial [Pontixanthobacter sp.]
EDAQTQVQFLKMKVGRLEKSWTGNCLATGLSQGFIEPLEATALHIVIATALEFARAYETGDFTAQNRDAFNQVSAQRYEGIRDYIVGHYRLNQRTDTEYWRANAANQNLSDNLKAMMTAWFTHEDMGAANAKTYPAPAYSQTSWHCLLAGYGSFPPAEKMHPLPENLQAGDADGVRKMLNSCAKNFSKLDVI